MKETKRGLRKVNMMSSGSVQTQPPSHQQKDKPGSFMSSNNILALGTILLILITTSTHIFIYRSTMPTAVPSGFATNGEISICINRAPLLDVPCNGTWPVLRSYYCQVNGSDPEDMTVILSDDTDLFNITQSGVISFIPLIEQEAQYNITISVDDQSVCTNNIVSKSFLLNITTCILPNWTKFQNALSTNLSRMTCWKNISDLTLGIENTAQVIWYSSLTTINMYNLDNNTVYRHRYLAINSSALPNLDKLSRVKFLNVTMDSPMVFRNQEPCPANVCDVPTYGGSMIVPGNVTFRVTDFTYPLYLEEASNLTIWDETDARIRYLNHTVKVYANYSYKNSSPIHSGWCDLTINMTSGLTLGGSMTYNSTLGLFTYEEKVPRQGVHPYTITCNRTSYYASTESDSLVITNRPPIQIAIIPNETWLEDTTLSGRDLDNYYIDPDGDVLNFTNTLIANIRISYNDHNAYSARPDHDWWGIRNTIFTANDGFNGSTDSNLVIFTVLNQDEPLRIETGGGAGGGGGGSAFRCTPYWICEDWGPCLPNNIQVRTCTDLGECNTSQNMPDIVQNCTYVPTCSDNIKNQGEEGVDCGGPCLPCPTCDDGLKNQGEEGVDCGGPCWPCDSRESLLAFSSYRDDSWQVRIKDMTIEQEIVVMTSAEDEPFVAWSPDGVWLAFTQDGSLMITNNRGKQTSHLTDIGQIHGLSWSNSETLMYSEFDEVSAKEQIKTININSKEQTIITTTMPAYFPDASPYKELLTFSTGYYYPMILHQNEIPITGFTILETLGGFQIESHLLVMEGDSEPYALTESQINAYSPSLSPDNSKIVYFREENQGSSIWLYNFQEDEHKRLTTAKYDNLFPRWTHNGDKIVFLSNRKGYYQIYTMKPDGDVSLIYREPYDVFSADWYITSSCEDQLKNQGEEGVDCGGPCTPCNSCNDGLLNQGETGIDCGGPCTPCTGIQEVELQKPLGQVRELWPWLLIIIIIIIIIVFRKYELRTYQKAKKQLRVLAGKFKSSKKPTLEVVEENILDELRRIMAGFEKKSAIELFEDLDAAMRGFIVNVFRLEYSFTPEELEEDLKEHKVPKKVTDITLGLYQKLDEWKYKEGELTKDIVKELGIQSEKVIRLLTDKEAAHARKMKTRKLRDRLQRAHQFIIAGKGDKAKQEYLEATQDYNQLHEHDKEAVYKEFVLLHEKLSELLKNENR